MPAGVLLPPGKKRHAALKKTLAAPPADSSMQGASTAFADKPPTGPPAQKQATARIRAPVPKTAPVLARAPEPMPPTCESRSRVVKRHREEEQTEKKETEEDILVRLLRTGAKQMAAERR